MKDTSPRVGAFIGQAPPGGERLLLRTAVRSLFLLVPLIALFTGAHPASAHHAFSAEYDANRKVLLRGNVTKIEWSNPHAHFFLDVSDSGGKVSTWDLELASPNTLERSGWTRKSLKVGDLVIVNGYLAKDNTKLAHVRDVRLADGRRVPTDSARRNVPTDRPAK